MAKKDSRKKIRLDVAVVERGLFETRQEARTAIMDGAVLVNNEKLTKPGASVSQDDSIELRPGFTKQRYVSRGGLKLEKAIERFQIEAKDRVCLDIGASTGGFTDCLLQNGAARVFAVDVGYGQIDWKLRSDARVIVKERMNARYLTASMLYENEEPRATLATIDCSFISLTKVLPAVIDSMDESFFEIICLVKPQFEAGKESVNKGVIRDPGVHVEVLETVIEWVKSQKLSPSALTHSPLKGPKGNIEYLLLIRKEPSPMRKEETYGPTGLEHSTPVDARAIVDAAFSELTSSQPDDSETE